MEHFEDEINSIDEETYSLLNNGSLSDKRSTNGCDDEDDDNEDTRSELKFDKALETAEEVTKRDAIEEALRNKNTPLRVWQTFSRTPYGLVADDLRCKIWPLLLELDPDPNEKVPSLEELSTHEEYQQVVLDVNRSLKRFPPGIPYKQRVALQDQLTVLILRVIMKYPHLRYYQGYHDVAVTFLLVVGENVAFRIMEVLSTNHLRGCMEPTMEETSYKLNYIYALLSKVDPELHKFMDRAEVGTMFALPWYLTWFGHSLNQYKDVVRLYDFFLASPPEMPLYVATALTVYRRDEVFAESCDMASVHCLLSRIPDDLDFEQILEEASEYFEKYPPGALEPLVKIRLQKEREQRLRDMRLAQNLRNKSGGSLWRRMNVPAWLIFNCRNRYGLLFAAATVLIGYIYYLRMTEGRYPFISYFTT